jgi:hypothetical protein
VDDRTVRRQITQKEETVRTEQPSALRTMLNENPTLRHELRTKGLSTDITVALINLCNLRDLSDEELSKKSGVPIQTIQEYKCTPEPLKSNDIEEHECATVINIKFGEKVTNFDFEILAKLFEALEALPIFLVFPHEQESDLGELKIWPSDYFSCDTEQSPT